MEYQLQELFESISEEEKNQPLNMLDKGLRTQLIADMMNSGILQFSQEAVNEIVKEVDTKEKLNSVYKKVKDLKTKIPKKTLPIGATFIVDTLPDGSLPVFSAEQDREYLKEQIYNGPDIDHSVSITPSPTEQVKTPPPSKTALEEKKAEIKERVQAIQANSFKRPGSTAPVVRPLETNGDFLSEMQEMGLFTNSYEEQDQTLKFLTWNQANFDALKNFIKVYRKSKNFGEKEILARGIKEIVRDINSAKIPNFGDAFSTLNLLNRLVENSIFLTVKEKETFHKWIPSERSELERKITNHQFDRIASNKDIVSELESANDIRDFILRTNRALEYSAHESIIKSIEEGEPLKSPSLRRTIKDMVHRLRVWGVIENSAEACDAQYNKCMKWDPFNVNALVQELSLISDGVLLFEELTKGQMQDIRTIITQYNDYPKVKTRVQPSVNSKPIVEAVPKTATFKYNEQIDTLTTPGMGVSWGGSWETTPSININDNGIVLKAPSINLDSPNVMINGFKINPAGAFINTLPPPLPEIVSVKIDSPSKEDLGVWKDIFEDLDIKDVKVHSHPDMFNPQDDLFDWDVYNTKPLTLPSDLKKEDSQFVREVKQAGVRVAATQLNKVTKGIIATALPGDKSAALHQFLDSELGTSFVSMINGMALTYGMKDNERAQVMAKEFRISSMTTAGNFAAEEILALVSGVVADSLTENISKSIKEIDGEEEIEIDYEDFIEEKTLKV